MQAAKLSPTPKIAIFSFSHQGRKKILRSGTFATSRLSLWSWTPRTSLKLRELAQSWAVPREEFLYYFVPKFGLGRGNWETMKIKQPQFGLRSELEGLRTLGSLSCPGTPAAARSSLVQTSGLTRLPTRHITVDQIPGCILALGASVLQSYLDNPVYSSQRYGQPVPGI